MIMNNSEHGVHVLEGQTRTQHEYRHFSTYYGFRLPLLGSNGHKILVLAFPSTCTFMIMNDSELGVHLLEGWTCTRPQYRYFATYYGFWLHFLG